jgi:hypothetical protein
LRHWFLLGRLWPPGQEQVRCRTNYLPRDGG